VSEAVSVATARAVPLDAAALAMLEAYFGVPFAAEPALRELMVGIEIGGGQWLFRQDEAGDSLYLLVRGRLRVWRDVPEESGEEDVLLGEVAPGESVGEVGLLTGQPRSAGVRAIRDSLLVRVDRQAFETLAARNPPLVMKLAASVAERLRQNMLPSAAGKRVPRTIALLPLDHSPRVAHFCDALVAGLAAQDAVIEVHRETLGKLGAPRGSLDSDERLDAELKQWFGDLESRARPLVLRCDAGDTRWSSFCLRQADLVLRVAEAGAHAAPRDWEQRLDAWNARSSGGSRQALVLLQEDSAQPITGTLDWLGPRALDFHLHVRADRPDDIARVVRVVSGRAIGLVLGAGAARGFAHLGVNRALREAGVPIDWIGGSSVGAIMGASMAFDWPAERSRQVAFDAFVGGKPFSDYTLPLVSLLSGKRMRRLLRQALPGHIEDMPIPFFCLSSNLASGQVNLHTRGLVWTALAASAALPGVLPPTVHGAQLAIDGSVLNSLPVDVMQSMPVARVIAVDLSSRKDFQLDYDRIPSGWRLVRARFGPKSRRLRIPNLATLMLKSTEIGTVARVREQSMRADLLLAPAVSRFSMMDVSQFDRVVDAGYQAALAALPAWIAAQPDLRSPAAAIPAP
jgi:predicted acylesterase/phospholipase RssA/CRP-like cAMP-binding protein